MGDSAFSNSFWISIKRVVIGTIWTMVVLIMMSYPLAKRQNRVQTEKRPDVDPGILYAVQWVVPFRGSSPLKLWYDRYDGSTGSGWFCSGIQRTPDDELASAASRGTSRQPV